jgi:GGDEF domain-containing protein
LSSTVLAESPQNPLIEEIIPFILEANEGGSHFSFLSVHVNAYPTLTENAGEHDVSNNLNHELFDQIKERVQSCLRDSDTLGEIRKNEFFVILNGAGTLVTGFVIKRINDAITKPFSAGNGQLSIQVSIGSSVFPDHGLSAETLIKKAAASQSKNGMHLTGKYASYTKKQHA